MNQAFRSIDEIIQLGIKYPIIYPDVPWEYQDKALAGNRGAGCKYDVMPLSEIKQLPVDKIASADCILFFWGTWPHYKDAIDVIESWNFTYKTCAFVWIKRYSNGKLSKMMGGWTRSNTEFCLLATRGHPHRISKSVQQVLETIDDKTWTPEAINTDVTEHSEKPDVFRQRIVQLCGDLPRLEMFARIKAHGWDAMGDDPNLFAKTLDD